MVLQLLIWSGEWKYMFDISCNFTADLWLPTDWIENRLCDTKIAERIMENDKLTVDQRYRVACMYCLEEFISSLWNELSPERRNIYITDSPDELPKSNGLNFCMNHKDSRVKSIYTEYCIGMLYMNIEQKSLYFPGINLVKIHVMRKFYALLKANQIMRNFLMVRDKCCHLKTV
ncbi:hypothetical protein X975_10200, partial [Stegodyphus mimosarum]